MRCQRGCGACGACGACESVHGSIPLEEGESNIDQTSPTVHTQTHTRVGRFMRTSCGLVSPQYNTLLQALEKMAQHHPCFLLDSSPEDTSQWRQWIDYFKLSLTFTFYKYVCGNYLGTLIYSYERYPQVAMAS